MNMNVRLYEDIIQNKTITTIQSNNNINKDIIVSGDTYIVNTGQILWKNTPKTMSVLQQL
jgi:hypothetical protein